MMKSLSILASLGLRIAKANLTRRRLPVFLSLFITHRCNLRCRYCFVSDPKTEKAFLRFEYSLDEIRRIVDEFHSLGTRMIFLLGGEPMVHREIGAIVDYIVSKGIYLHLITNGTLLEKKIEEIRNVHVLCVSLDDAGAANDRLRGEGVLARATAGIRVAVARKIPTRVHAVLSRHNLHSIRDLAGLCRDLGVDLTVSPPNHLGGTELDYLRISDGEYKEFWRDYLAMQNEGLPIVNSSHAIRQCRDWPVDYHRFIRAGERFRDYRPTVCLNGRLYVALGADGTMYNCINLGCTHGPNIKEMPIRTAWERLPEWRPDCVSCSSINCIETALLLKLRFGAILEGMRFHRSFF